MADEIRVVDYDPAWPARFEAERSALSAALSGRAALVEHIGSTSVPGLAAKDTIDLMVGLARLDLGSDLPAAMGRLGYDDLGEYGIPGRRFFRKGLPPTHHVHVVRRGGDFWTKQLVFRDYLRARPSWCQAYARIKRDLSTRFARDRAAYTEAKTDFILGLQERAWRWAGAALVVYDLEATCWEGGQPPERQEAIEIGAVRLDASLKPVAEFRSLIRPKDEREVSSFCTRLTGLTQDDVDSAPEFPEAMEGFASWLGNGLFRLASWSRYDQDQLLRDAARHGRELATELQRHLDLRDFYARQRRIAPCPMIEALGREGMAFEGRQHGALADARNAARLAERLLQPLAP